MLIEFLFCTARLCGCFLSTGSFMKKQLALFLAFLFIGGMIMSSCVKTPSFPEDSDTNSGDRSDTQTPGTVFDGNLAYGCPYFYDYGIKIEGDDNISLLTDGKNDKAVRLTPSLSSTGKTTFKSADWSGNVRELELDNSKAGIYVDLGFICHINSFELVANVSECEVFYSTDGYNYTFYAGTFGKSGVMPVWAKSVLFVIPFGDGIEISQIIINGSRTNSRVLLSHGASYTWHGTKAHPDEDGTKLTDGITYESNGKSALTQSRASVKDEITGKNGVTMDMDLGKVCNVSEVIFGLYSSSYPERVTVRYSLDNRDWSDLGQSYMRTYSGKAQSVSKMYSVTRPDTVKARYIRIYFYAETVTTDEIYVYGCNNEVTADYEFISSKNRVSYSNIARDNKVYIDSHDGEAVHILTDGAFYKYADLPESGSFAFTSEAPVSFCGASVTYKGKITSWDVFCDDKPVENLLIYTANAGSNETAYFYFDDREGENIVIRFEASEQTQASEVQIYAGTPHIPVVRGGFVQLFTGMSSTVSEMNSEYSWYLFIKGMRDLGMEYLVISEAANYRSKITLLKSGRTVDAGYKYEQIYGCTDIYEAILSAADELGMNVFLGTITGADFANPTTNIDLINGVIHDSEYVIRDLQEQYGHHKSVYGYYLNDEQCDYYMIYADGVKYGRMVYKAQSDLIRELAPDAKIMISPAIWRSGGYSAAGKALYNMVKPESEGEKPIVDIISAQDCLGRTDELIVTDAVFDEYGRYCEEWAENARKAGVEFWHDAEVFEQTYTYKRYDELVRSFGYEAKLSGTTIVFDIPHYFSPFPLSSYNDERRYYGRCVMREYVKYYSAFADINKKMP